MLWTQTAVPDHLIDERDWFVDVEPMEIGVSEISSSSARNSKTHEGNEDEADFTQLLWTEHRPADTKQNFKISSTSYKTRAVIVPKYLSHTTVPQSMLAENNRKFLITPRTAASDEGNQELLDRVEDPEYLASHGWSPLAGVRCEQIDQRHRAEKYHSYVKEFLAEIGIDENAVLDYLLDAEFEDRSLVDEARKLLKNDDYKHFTRLGEIRDKFLENIYDDKTTRVDDMETVRNEGVWKEVRGRLKPVSPRELAIAVLACNAFYESEGFGLWDVVRYGPLATTILNDITEERHSKLNPKKKSTREFQYRDLACRLCHLHACPFHGKALEVLGDNIVRKNSKEEVVPRSGLTAEDGRDIAGLMEFEASNNTIWEPVIAPQRMLGASVRVNRHFNTRHWTMDSGAWKIKERETFYPCDHDGPCKGNKNCSCSKQGIYCEKGCGCDASCVERFPGCKCRPKGGRTCIGNDHCLCYILRRECDPDLCGSCLVVDVLNPVNKKSKNEAWLDDRCKNCYIQRGVATKTWLAESEVEGAGFGLFAGVDIKKHEFIGEYKGENVSATELKRREIVDDRTYYLFDLCGDTTTDAGTKGNKIRFVNNSSQHDNCIAHNMLCNMQVRIGLYATRDIKAGEELYFNYNWPEHVRQHLEFGERDGRREKVPKSKGTGKGKKTKGKDKKPFSKPIITGASKQTREGSTSSSQTSSSSHTRGFALTRENLSRLDSAVDHDEDDEAAEEVEESLGDEVHDHLDEEEVRQINVSNSEDDDYHDTISNEESVDGEAVEESEASDGAEGEDESMSDTDY